MNRRVLAQRLARHAIAVAPSERRAWALGVAAELAHIDSDGEALGFAAGAVWAADRQSACLKANWLRFGRWGAALWTGLLGLGLFYMSVRFQRLPGAQAPVQFSGLLVLLGCAYVGAGWSLANRRLRLFAGLVIGMSALLSAAAVLFVGGSDAASPHAFYAALLAQEPAPRGAFYAAFLLEESMFLLLLAATGAFFWRAERGAPRSPA